MSLRRHEQKRSEGIEIHQLVYADTTMEETIRPLKPPTSSSAAEITAPPRMQVVRFQASLRPSPPADHTSPTRTPSPSVDSDHLPSLSLARHLQLHLSKSAAQHSSPVCFILGGKLGVQPQELAGRHPRALVTTCEIQNLMAEIQLLLLELTPAAAWLKFAYWEFVLLKAEPESGRE